jgi:hypothetical protein
MSGRLTATLVSFVMLTSVDFALTITWRTFVSSDRIYPMRTTSIRHLASL